MAWNQPDEQKPRAPQRASAPLSRWRRWLRSPPPWPGGRGLGAMVLVLFLGWVGTGVHDIDRNERAQVLRFGHEVDFLEPGSAWRLPWPLERLRYVDVEKVHQAEVSSPMRAAGGELLDVELVVRWRVNDARTFLDGAVDAEASVKLIAAAAMRPVLASLAAEDVFASVQRRALIEPVRAAVQARLDTLGLGVAIEDVDIARFEVPGMAEQGARQLLQAVKRRDELMDQARTYERQILPLAQQRVERSLEEARTYRTDVVAAAESDAARFEALLPGYRAGPQVMRERMYIEAVEEILGRAHTVVVDNGANAGAPIYLPLDKILAGNAPAVPTQQQAPVAGQPGAAPPAAVAPPAPEPGVASADPARSRDRTRSRDRLLR